MKIVKFLAVHIFHHRCLTVSLTCPLTPSLSVKNSQNNFFSVVLPNDEFARFD